MNKYPEKRKCKFCKDMAILMDKDPDDKPKKISEYYYYHYSKDYDLGCHQRIGTNNKERMKSLTKWTKDDEIRSLTERVKELEPARDFFFNYRMMFIHHKWKAKLIKWLMKEKKNG